ncbi:hypothetical protein SPRG_00388 [Saprolegnia parasitica CBS 223.65]|uniref:Uncharacterized protein n=1 Tax=Saprolegnia parasitica (strain CBS 223.65) TaxID=695850 RepID=A0A067D961_SAPPC|nr:hypothetical protein SPRG_00388 [Saprolegnia parasitica CBS 223.65]KDO35542.1 hypothetical protein SPRG_00388 [Saprolegnia parasitica CBS 223.65]|eukprot:XP_012193877.1 hypothetical protein SPRG_00388 [Saprolegnia parasitica CBS 223.65]
MTKRLRFSTVTTYEFPLTYGGSAVPEATGPPIGLAPVHVHETVAALLASPARRGRVAKWPHDARMEVLKRAAFSPQEIASICFEAIDIRRSRLETLDEIQALRATELKQKRRELRQARRDARQRAAIEKLRGVDEKDVAKERNNDDGEAPLAKRPRVDDGNN